MLRSSVSKMAGASWKTCRVQLVKNLQESSQYDGIVLVGENIEHQDSAIRTALEHQKTLDAAFAKEGGVVPVSLPAKRLVFAPTGPLNRDFDDVRRFHDAAVKGIKRALSAGIKKPILSIACDKLGDQHDYQHADMVTMLGALCALYVPLEVREALPEKLRKVEELGIHSPSLHDDKSINLVEALEAGRVVARDIGGSDPERMAAPKVEEYVREVFKGTTVSIEVISDADTLLKEYPLFAAVNRCANGTERHQGRILYLTYEGKGPITQTLFLVGKGVTYDTGGCDIKAGGIMAGMHRDKCGSAAVAGFMRVLAALQPKNLKVIGAMAMVRNSIGSEAYVADEIITSRAGVRIRVGNTDAEGRMAMADVLCRVKEMALTAVNPELFTIATLTGHAVLATGSAYSLIMDNGPARNKQTASLIQQAGHLVGDPLEISTIRREDYDFVCGKSEYEDLLQSNNLPSSRTPRGHQMPAAFMIRAARLDEHGLDSAKPIPYSHLDIAGSSGPFPGIPTGAPLLALTRHFLAPSFS